MHHFQSSHRDKEIYFILRMLRGTRRVLVSVAGSVTSNKYSDIIPIEISPGTQRSLTVKQPSIADFKQKEVKQRLFLFGGYVAWWQGKR